MKSLLLLSFLMILNTNIFLAQVNYPKIDKMEKALYTQLYQDEDIAQRLDRLEKTTFGSVQQGDLSDRTENLEKKLLNAENNDDQILSDSLSKLEEAILNSTYNGDNPDERIGRIEDKLMGKTYQYDTQEERLERILAVVKAQSSSDSYQDNQSNFNANQTAVGMTILGIGLMILKMLIL